MTDKQKDAIHRMVEQFIVVADQKFHIYDNERLEKVMRNSILKKQPQIMEYAIAYMKTLV